jgi:serine protease Do
MSRVYVAITCLILGGLAGTFVAAPALQGQAKVGSDAPYPKELTSYRDVVKKVLPAVVRIESTSKPRPAAQRPNQPRRRPQVDEDGVPEEFRRFFEEFQRRQMDQDDMPPQQAFGSGFIVDPKGIILTNHHVVNGADEVTITLQDDRKFTSKEVHSDARTDLAIIRIKEKDLPYLELGDSGQMEQGDRVLAVGAPFNLAGSVTAGIISAKGRILNNGPGDRDDFLQTDAAINPGNSGGPLVSLDGKVIGITSAIKSRTGGFQGVGLAISSNLAKRISEKLLKDGVVHRGYLGVVMKDLIDKELARRLGVDEGGVVISRAYDKSPAAKAGIKSGDIIIAFDGKSIKEGRALQGIVNELPLGKPINTTVVRDGKRQSLKVTLEEMPANYGVERIQYPRVPKADETAITLNSIGAEVMDLTEELAKEMGLKDVASGAVVIKVKPETPATQANLFPGFVITKADKKPITSAVELRDAIKDGALKNGVLLQGESITTGTVYTLLKTSDAASK